MFNDNRFGTIKGLSDKRRLPRLGIIRLGLKVKSEKTGNEYPKETDYFVCPPEVQKVYTDKPKELDIMIPLENRSVIFPQAYRHYGSSKGLKCIGNGEQAMRWDEEKKEMVDCECPCDKLDKDCKKRAFLMAILPKVSMGGIYQISSGSYNSIVDINSGLDYIEALIGRISMIPLKLRREPVETHFEGKKQTHYTLKVVFDGNAEFINQLRENNKRILLEEKRIALPPPKDENPEMDEVDEVVDADIKDEEKPEKSPIDKYENHANENTINDIDNILMLSRNDMTAKVYDMIKKNYPKIKNKEGAAKLLDNWKKGETYSNISPVDLTKFYYAVKSSEVLQF